MTAKISGERACSVYAEMQETAQAVDKDKCIMVQHTEGSRGTRELYIEHLAYNLNTHNKMIAPATVMQQTIQPNTL